MLKYNHKQDRTNEWTNEWIKRTDYKDFSPAQEITKYWRMSGWSGESKWSATFEDRAGSGGYRNIAESIKFEDTWNLKILRNLKIMFRRMLKYHRKGKLKRFMKFKGTYINNFRQEFEIKLNNATLTKRVMLGDGLSVSLAAISCTCVDPRS